MCPDSEADGLKNHVLTRSDCIRLYILALKMALDADRV